MPNLNVYLTEGFTSQQKKALLQRMTDAVVDSISAPRASVRIFLIELAKSQICVGGRMLDEHEQHGGPTVHALLVAGRSDAQKAALIGALTAVIDETLGVPAEPVRIMIIDIPSTDFGMHGVTAHSLGR